MSELKEKTACSTEAMKAGVVGGCASAADSGDAVGSGEAAGSRDATDNGKAASNRVATGKGEAASNEVTAEQSEGTPSEKAQRKSDPHRVDMIAEARAAQFKADAGMRGFLKILAPSKVNLHLAIGAKRADGYHEALSVMHAMALHDTVYLRRTPGGVPDYTQAELSNVALGGPEGNLVVRVECIARGGVPALQVPAERNIAFRAVNELACELGRIEPDAFELYIEKHIPHQGGLGGGSADAAAALVGMARLWGVPASDPAIERVAMRLGADVAFFLHGGCACLDGAGERFVHSLDPMKKSVVLVKPEGGVSTAAAYAAFDANPAMVGEELQRRARAATRAEEVPLVNNLAAASESLMPELTSVREWLLGQPGVEEVMLCGSGATTFAIVDTMRTAARIAADAGARGWWARSTMFGNVRVGVQAL